MLPKNNRRSKDRTVNERTADPYRDTDVIDARASRVNQATIGSLAVVAYLIDWWPLLAILAIQLFVGLRFGRRYCLPCLAYFELIQPRFGEGPIEDARPPRFANMVGLAVLGAASVAHAVGLETLGWSLGILVAALALLAATPGFFCGFKLLCAGPRLRGRLPSAAPAPAPRRPPLVSTSRRSRRWRGGPPPRAAALDASSMGGAPACEASTAIGSIT